MLRVDAGEWRLFAVNELFITEVKNKKLQVPTGSYIQKKELSPGTTPRITVSGTNNGIVGYYEDTDNKDYRVYENFISVSFLGTVFYQSGRASLDMKVHCLKPLDVELNGRIALFLVAIIRRVLGDIEYFDQISSTYLPTLKLPLPVNASGEPDWVYMDSYMSEVMKESKVRLENLRQADEDKHNVDTSGWKSFAVGELFPTMIKPSVLHTRQVTENNKGIPYVVRKKFNNGIKYRVHPVDSVNPSPSGVITWGAENPTFFYQAKEFLSGRDIYYIDTRNHSANVCMFLATCLQRVAYKYPYDYGLFPELLKKEQIKLPVNASGEPDWVYMDSYMSEVMKESKVRLENLIIHE